MGTEELEEGRTDESHKPKNAVRKPAPVQQQESALKAEKGYFLEYD